MILVIALVRFNVTLRATINGSIIIGYTAIIYERTVLSPLSFDTHSHNQLKYNYWLVYVYGPNL